MGQLLKINFEDKEHTFKLLSALPNDRLAGSLELLVNGQMQVLEHNAGNWSFANNHDAEFNRLANAIGKAIALRFGLV